MEPADPTKDKDSLCSTCKYGLCVRQVQQGEIIHVDAPQQPAEAESWKEQEESQPDEHVLIRGNGQFSFCFYPVVVMKSEMPIQFEYVEKCSRYTPEKELTNKGRAVK